VCFVVTQLTGKIKIIMEKYIKMFVGKVRVLGEYLKGGREGGRRRERSEGGSSCAALDLLQGYHRSSGEEGLPLPLLPISELWEFYTKTFYFERNNTFPKLPQHNGLATT
jgi:hypothetical protein